MIRPQPVIWSHPAVVTYLTVSGSVVTKLFGGPNGGAGSEKSTSCAARRNSCLASSAASGRPSGPAFIWPFSTAFCAAE